MKNVLKPFIIVLIISVLFSDDSSSYKFENNSIQTQEVVNLDVATDMEENNQEQKGTTIAEKIFNNSYSICQNTLDFIKAFGDEVIERMN